jgi:hypothetical protein
LCFVFLENVIINSELSNNKKTEAFLLRFLNFFVNKTTVILVF